MARGQVAPARHWRLCLVLLLTGVQLLKLQCSDALSASSLGALAQVTMYSLAMASLGAVETTANRPIPPNTTTGMLPNGVEFTYAPNILNTAPLDVPNTFFKGVVRPLGRNVTQLPGSTTLDLQGGAAALAAAAASLATTITATGPAPKQLDDNDRLNELPFGAVGHLSLNGGRSFCTATLIHPSYILTTASCLYHQGYNASIDPGCCATDPAGACCWAARPFLPMDGFSLAKTVEGDEVERPHGTVGVALIRWKGPETPYMAPGRVGNGFQGAPSDYALLQLERPINNAPTLPLEAECSGRYSLTIAGYGLGETPVAKDPPLYETTCTVEDPICYSDYVIPLGPCNMGRLGMDGGPVMVQKTDASGQLKWHIRGLVRSWCDANLRTCTKEAYELSPQDVYFINQRVATAPLNAGTFLCPAS